MGIEVRPATDFADVQTMVGPKPPDADVCWCLSYRILSKENLIPASRRHDVSRLRRPAPGASWLTSRQPSDLLQHLLPAP